MMDVSFRTAVLEEAVARFGKPDILKTCQGSQFASGAFTGARKSRHPDLNLTRIASSTTSSLSFCSAHSSMRTSILSIIPMATKHAKASPHGLPLQSLAPTLGARLQDADKYLAPEGQPAISAQWLCASHSFRRA